jgi:Zn2+/Cd2+-exporting ATPase
MKIAEWLQNPQQLRKSLVIASGSLIVLALAADYLAGWHALANGLHTAAALTAGWDIARRAWNSLRSRYASIELLVTIAFTGALLIGEFWEASAVTFLFILGAYLEARTLSRTRQVLGDLLDLAPAAAVVLRDGRQVTVMPHEVEMGETVLVKPGARLPVDGEVISGYSAVDESAITGEPIPAEKTRGSKAFAGTVNLQGLLQLRATGVGADTTLARIIRRVEEAQEAKAPVQRFIERFARWYTPAIVALSVVVYALSGSLELALTLLVIACPGALVIATPVAIVAGIGRAAKSGILIKGGEYLENAGKISVLAVDKTGTLTRGRPRLTDVIPFSGDEGDGGEGWSPAQREIVYWAAAAESGSEHPLAQAITRAGEMLEGGEPLPQAGEVEARPGKGIVAAVNGRQIGVGTPALMAELGLDLPEQAGQALDELRGAGKTGVLLAIDGRVLGALGISDPVRPGAAEMIRQVKKAGVKKVVMLTGDAQRTADAVARQVGVDQVYAGLLPDEKLEVVRRLQAEGQVVAMVGDGINDAPALAAADIGIAMGAAGSGVAIETADLALMADDLLKIPEAIRLSRATSRAIWQNLAIALATVAILLPGVLLGEVHMAGGMLVHQVSVLVVIANGMRLLRLGRPAGERAARPAPAPTGD